jgi:hypothetical protein
MRAHILLFVVLLSLLVCAQQYGEDLWDAVLRSVVYWGEVDGINETVRIFFFLNQQYILWKHRIYSWLTREYLSQDQVVDYPQLRRAKSNAYHNFARYLDAIKIVNTSALSPNASLAFWINAYNALAMKVTYILVLL